MFIHRNPYSIMASKLSVSAESQGHPAYHPLSYSIVKQFLAYTSIAIFSIFIGSQITEGALLVPYWKSLSSNAFYSYFQQFGPSIAQFYTILTIIAALIPLIVSIYAYWTKSKGFYYAVGSSVFAVLFIACFYVYFKGANEQFLQAAFTDTALKNELVTWNNWHWGRIGLEFISLILLILSLVKIPTKKTSLN